MNSITSVFASLRAVYEARYEPENIRPLVEWYWRVLLTGSLLGIIGVLAYGATEFFGVLGNLNDAQSVSRGTPPLILNRAQLADTLTKHKTRLDALEAAKGQQQQFADPSK